MGESSEAATAVYTVEATTTPSPAEVGRAAALAVTIKKSGAPVTTFSPLHGADLHFIAISSDLSEIVHTHPVLGTAGQFSDTVTFNNAQPYAVFGEFIPGGTTAEKVARATLSPLHAVTATPVLTAPYDGSAAKTITVDSTKVVVAAAPSGMVMPSMATHLSISIQTLAGAPVTDLEDWLGMPAHAIFVSKDLATFIHAHGMPDMGGGSSSGGHTGHGGHMSDAGGMGDAGAVSGALGVDVTFPSSGLYKVFFQFQRSGAIVTAPMAISVM